MRILLYFLVTFSCQGQETTKNGNVTTEAPSPFLKHGDSFEGQLASKLIASLPNSIAILISIDNWSKWALIEPQIEVECGKMVLKEEREDKGLPELIKPGYSEMVMFEKKPGISGVCGVVTYMLEVPYEEEPEYLTVMFSVPYNFQTYNAYFALGISDTYLNISGLFNTVYYYTGSFKRARAGKLIDYSSERLKIRGNMDPDSYKPILSISVLPLEPEDRFKPGEYYSPRIKGGASNLVRSIFMIFLANLLLIFL